jgi:alkanesulfonate monooxygenase SsuD/methylene tetrahydromethanopterin reductase-like flavin-dependent oxidoreductase (luciferase family)
VSVVSIGLAGALDHAHLRILAPRIEAAGFHGLWLNDTPHGDSIAGLVVAAEVTGSLALATGVIPMDRRPATEIAAAIRAARIPARRLTIGVGAGASASLGRVGEAIAVLRHATNAPILVGALGPRMRRLGAQVADGVLLSWLAPAFARDAMADLARDAAEAGRDDVRGVLYARTIVEEAASQALADEAARYESYPAYSANFERLGEEAIEAVVSGTTPESLRAEVGEYTGTVDELVLRAITPDDSLDSYLRFIDKAAAAL